MAMSWDQAAGLNEATKVIAVADVVESVRLMEQDEDSFIRRWRGFLGFVVERLPRHAGRLHKSLGDGLMVEFSDPDGCIRAARAMHDWFGAVNQQVGPEAHVHLRIGAHVANFVADAYDIYGNDVNLAARIASLAGPGEIVISAALRNRLGQALRRQLEDLGTCHLKHVRAPVHAFRIGQPGRAPVVPPGAGAPQPWRPLVAVRPFAVHGEMADPASGEKVTGDVVAALARAAHVHVVSHASMDQLENAGASRASPRDARVAYRLGGHLRWEQGQRVVFAELSHAQTGHVAWAQSFRADGHFGSAAGKMGVDQALANAVHSAIVAHETARAQAHALPSLDGSTLLLASIALMHSHGAPEMERAQLMLDHLAGRWPRHPEAHAWLAHLHLLRWQQEGTEDAAAQARGEAKQALQCAGGGALGLAMQGRLTAHLAGDLRAAEEQYARALALHPDDSLGLLFRAELKALQGDGGAAEVLCERAAAALPLSPLLYLRDLVLAQASLASGDAELALSRVGQALERGPGSLVARYTQAVALVCCGRIQQAQEIRKRPAIPS